MNKPKTLAILLATNLMLSGCSFLLPKKVEFFQDKVKAFPEAKAGEREIQRQTAFRAEEKAKETLSAALATDADATVVKPATETVDLTDAVSTSLGPPSSPARESKSSEALAADLREAVAALNKRVESFKADNNENAGKKIEGTGFFQIGYFSMWLLIFGGLVIVWFGLKVYGMVNPVVGLGVNTVGRVGSTILRRGLSEIAEGGEAFKAYVESHTQAALTKDEIKDLFLRAQKENQSRDVQEIVAKLTK